MSKKQKNHTPLYLFTLFAFSLLGYALYRYLAPVPQSIEINEVTSGNKKYGAVPSVTILSGSGSSYTYSYGFGGGFSGNSNVKMQGVAINNMFYPFGYVGEAAGFNPSKGVPFVTANGKYFTYGSSVVENKPPKVYEMAKGKLYYYNTSTKQCVLTSGTYNLFTKVNVDGSNSTCEANLSQYLSGKTSGRCYTSSKECRDLK